MGAVVGLVGEDPLVVPDRPRGRHVLNGERHLGQPLPQSGRHGMDSLGGDWPQVSQGCGPRVEHGCAIGHDGRRMVATGVDDRRQPPGRSARGEHHLDARGRGGSHRSLSARRHALVIAQERAVQVGCEQPDPRRLLTREPEAGRTHRGRFTVWGRE